VKYTREQWKEAIQRQEFEHDIKIHQHNAALLSLANTDDKLKELVIRLVIKPEYQEKARKEMYLRHEGNQISIWLGCMVGYMDSYLWIWRGNPYTRFVDPKVFDPMNFDRLSPEYAVFPSYPHDEIYVDVPETEKAGLLNAFRQLDKIERRMKE